jgi:O-antigen/teichoic acid export membrane protein
MSRKKLFIENIFAYGFINTLNKIIPFLLLPVITRILPDASAYGIFSMYTLVIGFGTPFAILGLYDAMFREYFEKDDLQYKYDVTTTAQRIILLSSLVISIILVLLNRIISNLLFGETTFGNIIIFAGIGIFLGANKSPIQAPTRMENQRKVFVVSGLLDSIVTYGLSLILIYLGLSYYGLIYSNVITSLVMVVFFWMRNRDYFLKGRFNKKIAKELFIIGLPLLPTFLIYWVYSSIDKIMITNILGTLELGIYSIGAKLAQISQLVYAAFSGGYAYFKYSTMKDTDQVSMNSRLFEYLGVISFSVFVLIFPFFKLLFQLLFEGSYQQGYIVMPYLFLSPLLLMLFQVVGSQFILVKKSYLTSISLAIGALINTILNFVLINAIGIEGAAIATLIGFIISLLMVSIIARRNNLLIIRKQFILLSILTIGYIVISRIIFNNNMPMNILLSVLALCFISYLYVSELKQSIHQCKVLLKKYF